VSLGTIVARALERPPGATWRWLVGALLRRVRAWRQRRRDRAHPSYAEGTVGGALGRYLTLEAEDIPPSLAEALGPVAEQILGHRFDLLGSGWTEVRYGASCRGLEGTRYPPGSAVEADGEGKWLERRVTLPNRAETRRLWRLIDDPAYRPIDWQLDFKSGYRWSERTWFRDVAVGRVRGADAKVPWELARLQHLPWLASAYLVAKTGRAGFRPAEAYRREIRSQILDFLSTNPPRFGINWRSPMDVGIRIANCLVAVDMLRAAGAELDAPFLATLERATLEHGRHIAAHLEWSEEARGNHYLANLVGLLFAAAYLPRAPESDAWLAFALQELGREIMVQFAADGALFEASTAYHCLSTELALYGAALALGLPRDKLAALESYDRNAVVLRPPFAPAPLPLYDVPGAGRAPLAPGAYQRLAAALGFARAVTKPDGRIVQIGDNDSGRLFKLQPAWRAISGADAVQWDEDMLDRRALLATGDALFGDAEPKATLDGAILRCFASGRRVTLPTRDAIAASDGDLATVLAELQRLPASSRRTIEIPLGSGVAVDLEARAFPDFGLALVRGPRLFVALRCAPGAARPPAPSGHGHDDDLSLEIQLDGHDLWTDPGSYLYTPVTARRDLYRSAAAHNGPRPQAGAAAALPNGPFDLVRRARGRFLHVCPDGLAARLDGPGWMAWRVVELLSDRLRVTDAVTPGALVPQNPNPPTISIGYGKLAPDAT
jgi:hypothetical protein